MFVGCGVVELEGLCARSVPLSIHLSLCEFVFEVSSYSMHVSFSIIALLYICE